MGDHRGKTVLIPRIALDTVTKTLPVKLQRLQFPVRLAFASTINKAQGQSLDNVGIDLSSPVFGHGQLYVAFSRATHPGRLTVLLEDSRYGLERKVKNVVYSRMVELY
ncbi:hypothetical protein FFLO_01285 [Filobasidium floriforme]|uniref:ATP-dependent DNA helicase n=1 Tax=Filobasidium floriforme TaxID=5210 RepID=A0A8K0NUZ3_9TREE|nr:hypothetical protein FFLO_01285 [Filobasidium floriforme]